VKRRLVLAASALVLAGVAGGVVRYTIFAARNGDLRDARPVLGEAGREPPPQALRREARRSPARPGLRSAFGTDEKGVLLFRVIGAKGQGRYFRDFDGP
jgi:hypothetical protein